MPDSQHALEGRVLGTGALWDVDLGGWRLQGEVRVSSMHQVEAELPHPHCTMGEGIPRARRGGLGSPFPPTHTCHFLSPITGSTPAPAAALGRG